jgi:hypothetical protein
MTFNQPKAAAPLAWRWSAQAQPHVRQRRMPSQSERQRGSARNCGLEQEDTRMSTAKEMLKVPNLVRRLRDFRVWNNKQHHYDPVSICGEAALEIESLQEQIEALHSAPRTLRSSDHRAALRRLVDVVWNEATESTAVPSTDWADRLIDRAMTNPAPTGSKEGK